MSDPGYSRQSTIRFYFRVAAVVVLVLAAYFLFVGFRDVVTAGSEPTRFWMLFVGLPLLAVGGWLAMAGWGGAMARYTAGEGLPVARDSLDYLSSGEGLGNLGRTHAVAEPTGGPYCRQCGTRNDAEARFCDSCGASLA
ncbi:zinc ribbon domain-containing protein [Nocardioides guangzhouensis]|uniref:Zinc ribbon domain-containing protein n=1 Tax=Nocardioides guangzhouensis TaxID=2497878 RepID=A0A4Q4ZCW1_9ACTN|nr:zinc ribbon domain-containing protein [Nocardioides guangzhouensis]RYP85014.1 zinc ribbon domain-containing protein [Nocardioides guangzhouensis]